MMRQRRVPVTFQPQGKTVEVPAGTRLAEAAGLAGILLEMPCGAEGTCGKCRLRLAEGAAEPTPAERHALSGAELDRGFRLACQSTISGPTTVEVPAASLGPAAVKILAELEAPGGRPLDPPVVKRYVELPVPDRTDDEADLSRIRRALGPVRVELSLLRELPGRLREARFCGTAVLADQELIDFEPGNTVSDCCAVALDLGTTTLAAVLVDMGTGQQLALQGRLNPQTAFGDDVLSRILHVERSAHGLQELQQAVAGAVDEMIGQLAQEAGVARQSIYEVTVSGNTTMQQLLAGIDPRWLGVVPFVPAAADPLRLQAAELGLRIHPRGRVYIQPVIGGFVGGDTVSGILATGLAECDGPALLVDIGTNGEIVLAAGGRLIAASTAAGPAFEGARITHGMRAGRGAIEKIAVDGRLRLTVIGNVLPVGLCGSALIDLAAELLRHGVVTSEGKLRPAGQLPDELPADLRQRIIRKDGTEAFLLVPQGQSGTGGPILLTQRDIRELQLAAGAMRAGIQVLLGRAGLKPSDLRTILVAGGFGNFIRRRNAQRIGLLPPEVPPERIRFQGNTSLAGARLVAVSRHARRLAEQLARQTEHVDLSREPGFRAAFAEAMVFPAI
ncbi:MAG: ASKHA domain-containing protein [Thermoguttaceae bacterium]